MIERNDTYNSCSTLFRFSPVLKGDMMSCASPLNSPQWLLPSDQIQTHRCSVVRTVTTHIVSGIFITSPLYLTCHHRATRRIVRKASEESSRRDPPQRKPQPPPPPPPRESGSTYCASSQRRVARRDTPHDTSTTATAFQRAARRIVRRPAKSRLDGHSQNKRFLDGPGS